MSGAQQRVRPIPLHPDRGLCLVRGEGSRVWDSEGRRYLDLMTGYGVSILGHAHPDVVTALCEQARLIGNVHQSFDSPARRQFLAALGAVLPDGLDRVAFANSGAEAIEAALKFARLATARTCFVSMNRGYHGRSFGALAVTGERRYREPFAPLPGPVRHVPFDDPGALEEALDDSVAAVIVEPIQGESGVRLPSPGYLAGVRELCDRAGALLVADEIQTAFRTGAPLACSAEGVVPDLLCLSKGIANGVPLGVVVTTGRVAGAVPRGSHGSTFAANSLACAAGAATLRVLADPDLHRRAGELGERAAGSLRALALPEVREVRGRGLMLAVELRRPATPVIRAMQERGALALPAGATAVRLLPSVLVGEAELDEGVAAFGEAVVATGRAGTES